MNPRIDPHEQAELEVDSEHEGDPRPLRIEVEVMVPVELATVFDLEPMLAGRPPELAILVRGERVTDKIQDSTIRTGCLQQKRSRRWIGAFDDTAAASFDGLLYLSHQGVAPDDSISLHGRSSSGVQSKRSNRHTFVPLPH